MEKVTENYAAGISMVAFIIAVGVSIGYYQFVYLPEANAKPHVPEEISNPSNAVQVSVAEGASLPSNPESFVPKDARGRLGNDNKIVWTNTDTTAHTVTTDTDFSDKLNGKFDSMETIGLIPPGQTFEFTFTEEGEFPYHCEPHPWMTGKVEIVKNFA
jgi:plastocyanin